MSNRKSFRLRPPPDLPAMTARLQAKIQAGYCESSNHWAMAAILWRRIGETERAEECEAILQRAAENHNVKLPERKPLIISQR